MPMQLANTALGTVEYCEAGDGDTILYFHGTGVSGDAMLPIEAPLVDDGFRLLIPSRPGYGRTPLEPHTSAVDCAHVAAALLDALNVDRAAVMGSSGGAAFALSFAVQHPERTRSLVLLCPQLHRWDAPEWLPAASRWTLPWIKRGFLRNVLLAGYRMQLARTSPMELLRMEAAARFDQCAGDPAAEQIAASSLAAMRQGTRCPGFENDMRIFATESIMDRDNLPSAPTLLIHDEADPMAPVAHVDWFASLVPHCERVNVCAGGHLIWVGPDSALVHQKRVDFLRRHR